MYHVIALVGGPNCGKTATLNRVHQYVLANGGESTDKRRLGGQPNDFSDVVRFNEKLIMFYTMGDFNDTGDFMAEYYRRGFDMFVCALGAGHPQPFVDIQQYANTQIRKTTAIGVSERETANTKDAEKICSLIYALANG